MTRPSFKLRRPTNADLRRQKYRSLLIQRQIAATTIAASMAPMSPSNANAKRAIGQPQQPNYTSSEEEDEDGVMSDSIASSSNMFASSIESSEQSAATTTT